MADYDPAAYGDACSRVTTTACINRGTIRDHRRGPRAPDEGRTILELGIGTGRLALPLYDAGWHVVGVEASDAMIRELHGRLGRSDDSQCIRGDIRSVQLEDRFDVVLFAFSTLFLLPDQQAQLDCLATGADHLVPGGFLIVEAFVPDHRGGRTASAWPSRAGRMTGSRSRQPATTEQTRRSRYGMFRLDPGPRCGP